MRFARGKTSEDYLDDEILRSAIERQFIILGESLARASRLSPRLDVPHLDQIIAFRNRLVHGYGTIDPRVVWGIVETRVADVRSALRIP